MNAQAPLPDGNPKTVFGQAKPGMADVPPVAMIHLGLAMTDGEKKYGRTNWREHHVSSSVYYNAAMRHLMSWWDGEEVAEDSQVHHLGHVMACCAIILDAQAQNTLRDDRPGIKGRFAEWVKKLTRPITARSAMAAPYLAPPAPMMFIGEMTDDLYAETARACGIADPSAKLQIVPEQNLQPVSRNEAMRAASAYLRGLWGDDKGSDPAPGIEVRKDRLQKWLMARGIAKVSDVEKQQDLNDLSLAIFGWTQDEQAKAARVHKPLDLVAPVRNRELEAERERMEKVVQDYIRPPYQQASTARTRDVQIFMAANGTQSVRGLGMVELGRLENLIDNWKAQGRQ